ncbi:MAG: ABC transporter ATP-binding protein [Lentisphaeria bacterium]|nr:ABC transporter ATP-binding protein [Lentisphaeria bacterium]
MLSFILKLRKTLAPAYKWGLLALSALMICGALLELAALGMVMMIVSVFTMPSRIHSEWYIDWLYRISGVDNLRQFLILLAVILILFYVVKSIYGWCLLYLQSLYVSKLTVQIVRRIYRNYLSAPYAWHAENGSAALIDRITRVESLANGLLRPLMLITTEVCVVCILGGVLLYIIPWITLGVFGCVLLLAFLFYLPLRKKILKYGEMNNHASAKSVLFLTQGISAVREVKLTGSRDYFEKQLEKEQWRRFISTKRITDFSEIPRFALEALCILIAMGILIILLLADIPENQIMVYAAMFISAMFRLLPSFTRIQYNVYTVRGYLPLFDLIYNDLCNLPQEDNIQDETKTQTGISIRSGIDVDHIDFAYRADLPLLFKDFSMHIACRESVAFVGKTGCGKSTLADIIMGFYPPQNGVVKVDGTPITDNMSAWRRKIGYVPQQMTLFDDTIRNNIAFGVPPEQIDPVKLRNAMNMAQLTDFIESLPDREYTVIGEGGVRLSGGQRQRIVIARALYHEPELLILDEATSALDNDTEKAVIDALKALKGKLTIIMIAHRLSSIEHCDRVISLDK